MYILYICVHFIFFEHFEHCYIRHGIFSPSHSHTVNLLSALPLQCLDVLLMVPVEPGSQQCQGVNMDCVHTLVLFMERRLDSVREKVIYREEPEPWDRLFLLKWPEGLFLVCLLFRVIKSRRSWLRSSICWQKAAGLTEKHVITSGSM